MKPSYSMTQLSIEECIKYLQENSSLVHNFIDIEVLEEFWLSIKLEEQDPLEYRRKRQELEHELKLFTTALRGIYREYDTPPEWMKSGSKLQDDFFISFFQQLKKLDASLLKKVEDITHKPISYYQQLFVRWKIARNNELSAPENIKQKSRHARILRRITEDLCELAREIE